MSARDDHPLLAGWARTETDTPSMLEARHALDEIDRLRAQLALAQADADRLAIALRSVISRHDPQEMRLLAAHDEAVAQR